MSESSFYGDLVAGLSAIHGIVAGATADTGTYTYRYATLASILRVVKPVLAAHHLTVTQPWYDTDREGWTAVETQLLHTSGGVHSSGRVSFRTPTTPQQTGSQLSYWRRYQLCALLGIGVEDDDGRQAAEAPPPRQVLSDEQVQELRDLFDALGVGGRDDGDARLDLCEVVLERAVSSLGDITPTDAPALIAGLRARVEARQEART